ncbi:MAG: MBL fold metallo-hydrolase [Imperialibacter sp.]|uniref:MBL fold metallo-hydrolase n=1 Tax=Imperialibacter sp. TaxID=2038411 RepID=UPI0032EE5E6F
MDVRVKFLGGAGSVTGSKYLLEIDDFKLLVDCGLFQGMKELRLRNWEAFPIDPAAIDAVVITHAHIDHSGYLPKLVKEGYAGPIYCTHATARLMEIMLRDSGKLQEEEAAYARKKGYSRHENPLPLYTLEEAEHSFSQFASLDIDKTFEVSPNISLRYLYAGHILGAAHAEIEITGEQQTKKLLFSGDIGRYDNQLLYDPTDIEKADILWVESTYGNKASPEADHKVALKRTILETFDANGCVLIPAFSVGRTQDILLLLAQLFQENAIPNCPVYIDSPMAISVTGLYKEFHKLHRLDDEMISKAPVFDHPNFKYVRTQDSSENINTVKRNAIIISASGMCTGGRVLHHLFHRLPRINDTVIIVGYQAEGTRGRRILDKEPQIRIFGEMVDLRCRVEYIQGFSAHADRNELIRWLKKIKVSPKYTFIVHGEKEGAEALAITTSTEMHFNTYIPHYMESFDLFQGI